MSIPSADVPIGGFKAFSTQDDPLARVIHCNVLDFLRISEDDDEAYKFHAVLTSPPFFGMRDYGLPRTMWGVTDPECPHKHWEETSGPRTKMSLQGCTEFRKHRALMDDQPPPTPETSQKGLRCAQCGCWFGCLGQEESPQEYVDHLLEVIDLCMKNLRQDGNMWMEIGDVSLSKCMAGVPQRVFIGIVDKLGYYVRRPNIWEVDNKKPQSQRDTTTLSHSEVLHIVHPCKKRFWTHDTKRGTRKRPPSDPVWVHRWTKVEVPEPLVSNERLRKLFWMRRTRWEGHDYYFDMEPIREQFAEETLPRSRRGRGKGSKWDPTGKDRTEHDDMGLSNPSRSRSKGSHFDKGKSGVIHGDDGGRGTRDDNPRGRSPRTVWTGTSALYGGAHFAVMPLWLADKCLQASISPAGCCSGCGAQWARRVIRGKSGHHCRPGCGCPNDPGYEKDWAGYGGFLASSLASDEFIPTCDCSEDDGRPLPTVPPVVFDPFVGSGTSLCAARRVGAVGIGCELSEKYCELAIGRVKSA